MLTRQFDFAGSIRQACQHRYLEANLQAAGYRHGIDYIAAA